MDVNVYTVCENSTGTVNNNNKGKIFPVVTNGRTDPYSFYATRTIRVPILDAEGNPTGNFQDAQDAHEVKVVMPLGGIRGGFFRFPQVGDMVLVGRTGDSAITIPEGGSPTISSSGDFVLLGYMPDNNTANRFYSESVDNNRDGDETGLSAGFLAEQKNPASMQDFRDDYGMALRYNWNFKNNEAGEPDPKKTGNITEIGFYRKQAKWPDMTPEKRKENKDRPLTFSPQDTVNIQSAGDIESRADNYQLLRAKRFEILVHTDELSPNLRYSNVNSSDWNQKHAPLGDNNPLDDPMLHTGDIHIRAERSIVLKADAEIRFQVGRTVVVINDTGFTVVTQKTNSGVNLSYDTSFSMTPRGGISMTGQKVNINGVNGFALGDSWGAGINGSIGGLNITGRFIKQSSMNTISSAFMLMANSIEAAQNISEGTAIITKPPSADEAFSRSVWFFNLAQTLITDIQSLWPFLAKTDTIKKFGDWVNRTPAVNSPDPAPANPPMDVTKLVGDLEPIEILTLALNMVLGITGTVYASIDTNWAQTWRDDLRVSREKGIERQHSVEWRAKMRDKLNIAALSVDNGIISLVLDAAIFIQVGANIPGASAEVRLRSSGDIVLSAAKYLNQYGEAKLSDAVTPSLTAKWVTQGAQAVSAATKISTDIAKLIASHDALWERVKPWLEKL
ncbi:MAG: hypothetical protein LBP42_01965 [Treponema sp.]|jgi:hypothetical protein|nr:hypothetical protein [Treponema sp.]